MTRTLSLFLAFAFALATVAPVAAEEREPPPDRGVTAEPFVAVGVLDLVTHRDGQTVFGLGLVSGRIEVACTARVRGADACEVLAERLLGATVLVRGREILSGGEHVAFRAGNFQRVN